MNIFDKAIESVEFVKRSIINGFISKNNITALVKAKPNNPIYDYLSTIIGVDYTNSKDEIMYASFKFEKNKDSNFIIFLNTELMDTYTKNLEVLKQNLLINKYSIPVSYISEQSNISSKSKKANEKDGNYNKIKYNYDIELSDSSQKTKIQIESFISNEKKQLIENKILEEFNESYKTIILNNIINDSEKIKLAMENRINNLKKNQLISQTKDKEELNNIQIKGQAKEKELDKIQPINEQTKEIVLVKNGTSSQSSKEINEFDEDYFVENFEELNLDDEKILFLINLFFNTDSKNENLINTLELCYNILIFNLIIEKDKYHKIKYVVNDSIKNYDFDKIKISDLYLLKVFDDKDEIKNLYFNSNKPDIKELERNNIKVNSVKSLEDNLDKILNTFSPFCLLYKKVEHLLKEYFNSFNKKSEKVSDYLDGYCLEDDIKNIITMENEDIIQLPNIYYILLNYDINFIEFDLICLIKINEKLNFNKSIFDRISYIHNLKILDNIDDIKGLSLVFFEIKNSQQSTKSIAKHLIEKVNFLYPLLKEYLFIKYNTKIEDCEIYFAYVFDSKFNANTFATPKIIEIKSNIKNLNITNKCKLIYIHGETNVGQYNSKKLKEEINEQKNKINELNIETEIQKNKINEMEKIHKIEMAELQKQIQELKNAVSELKKCSFGNQAQNNSDNKF